MDDKEITITGSSGNKLAPPAKDPEPRTADTNAMEVEEEGEPGLTIRGTSGATPAANPPDTAADAPETKEPEQSPGPLPNSADIAQRSVEGWVVVATGLHEEAHEEDLLDFFGNYGKVRNLHLNLDRQTGYVKGYALAEFEEFDDAKQAVEKGSGKKLLGLPLVVDFAFVKGGDDKFEESDERGHSPPRRRESRGSEGPRDYHDHRDRPSRASRRSAERSREGSPDRGF
ncbi:RNA-binding protein 8A [Coemansia sp. RSA 552]|nr:RNA-binding protein 8A [Coemansia sp. RSA 552]